MLPSQCKKKKKKRKLVQLVDVLKDFNKKLKDQGKNEKWCVSESKAAVLE